MITTKDIVKDTDPILRKKAVEVSVPISTEDISILNKMMEYLKSSQDEKLALKYNLRPGVGLAAPQIGVSKRIIAIYIKGEDFEFECGLFNPKIINHSNSKIYLSQGEGCLSFDPEIIGLVSRFEKITVKGIDQENREVTIELEGLLAVIFQHEIDHLDGILFTDYLDLNKPFKIPKDAKEI
ncbi:MAG TPA: peptide deformylase [Tenericutes bacterium]|jgi:peptide deformylase|nr:peptide deformylase [Mycoplasmatota bacterium]